MTPQYTHLIIDEDGTPFGTSDREAIAQYSNIDTHLVINLQTIKIEFSGEEIDVEELKFNPEDWK